MLDLFFSLRDVRGYDCNLCSGRLNKKAISITEVIDLVYRRIP